MGDEIRLIIEEKDKKIESLTKEMTTVKEEAEKKLEEARKKTVGMITKRSAAIDVYNRLKRLRISIGIGMVAPVLSFMVGEMNFMAGAVIGFASAVAITLVAKKELFSEIKRLEEKYSLKKND